MGPCSRTTVGIGPLNSRQQTHVHAPDWRVACNETAHCRGRRKDSCHRLPLGVGGSTIGPTTHCACRKRRLSSLGLPPQGEGFQLCLPQPPLAVGYRGCRNEGPAWWEPRSINGSLCLNLREIRILLCMQCLLSLQGFYVPTVSAFPTHSTLFPPHFSNSSTMCIK